MTDNVESVGTDDLSPSRSRDPVENPRGPERVSDRGIRPASSGRCSPFDPSAHGRVRRQYVTVGTDADPDNPIPGPGQEITDSRGGGLYAGQLVISVSDAVVSALR